MRGYKVLAIGLSAVVALTFAACDDKPTEPEQQAQFKPDKLGNGYPATQFDYKLNIIGVPRDKTADMDNNNGRRIFVQLFGGGEVTDPVGRTTNSRAKTRTRSTCATARTARTTTTRTSAATTGTLPTRIGTSA